MNIYDISLTISPDLPTWPGDPAVVIERIAMIENGANANVSRMEMGVHTGTHIDAPCHFIPDGISSEYLPLDILTGRSFVLDLQDTDIITETLLQKSGIPSGTVRLLIKTRNSNYWLKGENIFQTGFTGISADGAEFLVHLGVQLIGIDYLSVAPYKQSRPTHEIFLKAGVVIVEGLNLSGVTQGHYTLYCLPLKLKGSDGAPARAILMAD